MKENFIKMTQNTSGFFKSTSIQKLAVEIGLAILTASLATLTKKKEELQRYVTVDGREVTTKYVTDKRK